MNRKEKVDSIFMNDFNCSQVVLSLFSEELGLEKDVALKLTTGFGSGLRKGEVCGAVSGAVMVIGLKYGHYLKGDVSSKTKTYALTEEFERRFEDIYGSVRCKDILEYDLSKKDEMNIIKEKDLFSKVCPKAIKDAIDILEELL
jgi:C_GCAxxG_C_C family probable redox protein